MWILTVYSTRYINNCILNLKVHLENQYLLNVSGGNIRLAGEGSIPSHSQYDRSYGSFESRRGVQKNLRNHVEYD